MTADEPRPRRQSGGNGAPADDTTEPTADATTEPVPLSYEDREKLRARLVRKFH